MEMDELVRSAPGLEEELDVLEEEKDVLEVFGEFPTQMNSFKLIQYQETLSRNAWSQKPQTNPSHKSNLVRMGIR